jgi:hypothetical protein
MAHIGFRQELEQLSDSPLMPGASMLDIDAHGHRGEPCNNAKAAMCQAGFPGAWKAGVLGSAVTSGRPFSNRAVEAPRRGEPREQLSSQL